MRKWIFTIGVLLFIGLLAWYLFIKPYDYRVYFRAATFPGTINQTIKAWDQEQDSSSILQQGSLTDLTQRLTFHDSVHEYHWVIEPVTDSTSDVYVYAKDLNHGLRNRLFIPFSDTDFEKRTRKMILDFDEMLRQHVSKFKVRITGDATTKGTYCACIFERGRQVDKARGMMKNYPFLGSYLVDNDIPLNGPPFIEITQWDREHDSIAYNFCYPILKTDSLPIHPLLTYKIFPPRKAIKAIYNGNYITSDRAWYALLTYAAKNNRNITGLPIEIFHNNPNLGGDALDWTTEVFMPLKDDDK